MSRTYAQQKAGLTRAVRSKRWDKVVAECRRVIEEWQELPYGWPDDWHRWNIALMDAFSHVRHEYVNGRESVLPVPLDMDDLHRGVLEEQSRRRRQNELASLRKSLTDENISYGELADLEGMATAAGIDVTADDGQMTASDMLDALEAKERAAITEGSQVVTALGGRGVVTERYNDEHGRPCARVKDSKNGRITSWMLWGINPA